MHTQTTSTSGSQRGAVTILVLFLILFVFGLSLSMLQHGMSERRDVTAAQSSLAALHLAEYGLVKAELEFQAQADADGDGLGSVAGETYNSGKFNVGSYEVVAVPGAGNLYTLTSIGTRGLSVRRIEIGLEVTTRFAFRHAIFAVGDLRIDSSVATDSFNSGDGTWQSQATNNDASGDYAEATGHVGSNADVDIYSSVRIRGDARSGPTSSTSVHGGSADVSGDDSAMAAAVDIPTPELADFQDAYANNNNGEISSSGDTTYDSTRMNLEVDGSDTLHLSGGTYFFNDFTLNSSTTLIVDAPTKIYVTGDLLLTSSVSANISGNAADLSFICHPYNISPGWSGPSDRIELNSSLRAALTIYAPGRDIYMDSSVEIFGAIIGREVEVNSSIQVHYDRALSEGGGAAGAQTRRTFWRESSAPRR